MYRRLLPYSSNIVFGSKLTIEYSYSGVTMACFIEPSVYYEWHQTSGYMGATRQSASRMRFFDDVDGPTEIFSAYEIGISPGRELVSIYSR